MGLILAGCATHRKIANLGSEQVDIYKKDLADIDRYSEALNKAFEKMYQAGQQAQGGPQGPFQGGPQPGTQGQGPDEQ